MGSLERHTRDRPDARPYADLTDIAGNVMFRASTSLNLEEKVVLRVAAQAPKAARDELFLVVLIFLSLTPGSFLPIRNDLEEKRNGI